MITANPCPTCGANVGEWCHYWQNRYATWPHDSYKVTLGSPLLACPERRKITED